MRKLIFLLLFSFTSIVMFADDVIVLRNGDIINGIVTEVQTNEIKYKKSSNPNGPVYAEPKSNVLSIKYGNGEVDKFDQTSQPNAIANGSPAAPTKTKSIPMDDNTSIKAQYEVIPRLNIRSSKKKAKEFFPIMAFTDSSVISTKDLTIVIDPTAVEYYDGGWKVKMGYAIQIVNKTDQPIYIDRANSFRRFNDLSTQSYYDNQQTTVSHGNNSGGGIGLGIGPVGVGIGGSSGSTYSESHGTDRFLIIGPKSKANLLDYKYIRLSEKKAKFKTISDIEYWGFNLDKNIATPITEGEVKTYTEETTPYSNKYFITYSTDPEFKNCYTIDFELYAKHIVGAKIKHNKWAMSLPDGDSGQSSVATSRMVSEIQNTIPDFWTNSLVIIGTVGGEYK